MSQQVQEGGTIIDGKAFAAGLRTRVASQVTKLKQAHGITPGLAVVLVGENPASQVYVRNKNKQTVEAGMNSFEHRPPDSINEAELVALVDELNQDPKVNGILVQLPLPEQISSHAVIGSIDPAKDVDGFHVTNAGLLAVGGHGMVPCTPLGCMMLIKDVLGGDLSGQRALVLGRSNIARVICPRNAGVPIFWWPPSAGRRWSRATGSSPAPRSSTWASTASIPAKVRPGSSATSTSRRRAQGRARSRRSPEGSAR
jgi:hypothetical protein